MARSTFLITQRHGIWGVKLDGVFYGDFRSKSLALESVAEARRPLDAGGRDVHIVVTTDDGPLS